LKIGELDVLIFLKIRVVSKWEIKINIKKNKKTKKNKTRRFLKLSPKIETNGSHKKMKIIQHSYQPHQRLLLIQNQKYSSTIHHLSWISFPNKFINSP